MSTLSPTSLIVLGLLDVGGPCTPYELKARTAGSIGNFWSVPHSQLYAEPERLLERGFVEVTREESGRRRKVYAISEAGRAALRAWTADPAVGRPELRTPALLAVFLGADPREVAERQLPLHEAKLAEYEQLAAGADSAELPPGTPRGPRIALEAGIRHEREWVRYWTDVRAGDVA